MVRHTLLASALLVTSAGAASAHDVDTVHIELREVTANIEVQRGMLFGSAKRLEPPTNEVQDETWYGKIVRRRPGDPISSPSRSVSFAIVFDGRHATGAWFDMDADGITSDEREMKPYEYPGIPGARSFLVRIPNEGVGDGTGVLLRVLVPARPPRDRPEFRVHQVVGRTGEIPVDGRHLRALLFDGDADGVATMSSLDGLLVDLDGDGHVEVDFMSPEFASFASPIQLGTQRFRVLSVTPGGEHVVLLRTGEHPPRTYARVGEPAPEIEFMDAGSKHTLSSYRGTPVVVYFWASWCPTCRYQAEPVRDMALELHSKGLRIVGVNYDKEHEAMRSFETEQGFAWPSVSSGLDPWVDENGRNYRQNGVGVFYLIDASGILEGVYHDVSQLRSRIEGMLPD